MSTASRFSVLVACVALAFSAMAQTTYDSPAPAQSSAYQNQRASADPPARVARLSLVRGEVSFTPAGENDAVLAPLNRPLVTGDRLWTDANARAELQVGASTIHLNQQTGFDFLNLNDQTAQMELTQGSLNLDVRRVHRNETYEVDTPTLAFVANGVGDYRIDVDAQGTATTVTVRRGSGEIYGENGARVHIGEGQSLSFNNPQLRDYETHPVASRQDDFDAFAAERDQRYAQAPSRNYVSEDVVGYEDLDDNGTWSDVAEYGHVWYPSSVAVDWVPYRDGRWSWVEPWGWTWVDDAPWGFAPFHYGRWAYIDSRWGWVPGPLDVEPIYAPALVAFIGGGGFGIDISLGGPIGWFPLGPGDVYFPGYPCGRSYFAGINISNTRINAVTVNNYYVGFSSGNVNYAQISYANRNVPQAITAVPLNTFTAARPVAASAIAVNRAALTNARILPRAAVAPTRASVMAATGRGRMAPANVMNRPVVAAHAPPPAPASFAARQGLLKNHPGQPLSTTQMRTLAAQQSPRGVNGRANVHLASASAAASASARTAMTSRPMPGRVATAPQRSTVHAPTANTTLRESANNRAAQHTAQRAAQTASANAGVNRGAAANRTASAHVQSSTYAHAQGGPQNRRVTSAAQAPRPSSVMRNAPIRSAAQQTSRGRSTESAHVRATQTVRAQPTVTSEAQHARAMTTATPHRSLERPAYTRATVQQPSRTSFAAQSRAQNERGIAPTRHVESRATTMSHAQPPQYRRPVVERAQSQAPMRAESRPAPQHYSAPAATAQRGAPPVQRVASMPRQQHAPPQNPRKSKDNNHGG